MPKRWVERCCMTARGGRTSASGQTGAEVPLVPRSSLSASFITRAQHLSNNTLTFTLHPSLYSNPRSDYLKDCYPTNLCLASVANHCQKPPASLAALYDGSFRCHRLAILRYIPRLNIEMHEYDRCWTSALPARLPFKAVQNYTGLAQASSHALLTQVTRAFTPHCALRQMRLLNLPAMVANSTGVHGN